MKNKYIAIIIILLTIGISYLGIKYYYANKKISSMQELSYLCDNINKLDNIEKDKLISEAYPINNISEDEKREIAIKFFEEYINLHRTNWYQVKDNGGKIETTFSEYKIKDSYLTNEEENKFTFLICYDIKPANNSMFWVAGNGENGKDNWIINKLQYIDIIRYKDKYYLDNIYTG